MSFLDLCLPPIGPNLNRLSERKINLSGTSITLKVPDNNYWPEPGGEPETQSYNLYDMEFFRWEKEDLFEPESYCLLARAWQYKRILTRGYSTKVQVAVEVVRLPEFQSLFRPRRLECAVERIIYATPHFSTQKSGKNRLNWQIVDRDSRWVRYEYIGSGGAYDGAEHVGVVWNLPLTDEHLLRVRFRFIYHSDSELARKKCTELMELVMKSFRVELSADALRQKAAMEAAYPYERINPHLPPYEYEIIEVLSEWEMADKVGAQLNYDFSNGYQKFADLSDKAEKEQALRVQEVRDRILKTHLRFEELERQDYERYISSPPPEFKE